jgi:SAM-dependent methyltransferase
MVRATAEDKGMTTDPSPRKRRIRALADRLAPDRDAWWRRSAYFHAEDIRYLRFLIPAGARVLELGCANGDLLAALRPAVGVGVDFSEPMIETARGRHPGLQFVLADIEDPEWTRHVQGPFDYIVIVDTIGSLDDCQAALELLHSLCERQTRVIIAYYAYFWDPLLRLAEALRLKMPTEAQNVLSTDDIGGLLGLADFQVIQREWRQLIPLRLGGLGPLFNRFFGTLPVLRRFCLRNFVVSRSLRRAGTELRSATVIVPCRNERGNIEPAITRMPRFCGDIEIIFVEGHSRDGTYEEAQRVRDRHGGAWDIKVLRQDGVGKADAVFKGFDHARGDVLMILDADLTVPPEQLAKFWEAMASGKGEYVHGTRLVYPMEQQAMRFLNLLANWTFSVMFTWLLNRRLTDTLCGTKVLRRSDYLRLKANRDYFGHFDPFGDFDLIFGAAKLGLHTIEIPIRYASRSYGETQISRFRHGWMLLKMVAFAYRKLKAF